MGVYLSQRKRRLPEGKSRQRALPRDRRRDSRKRAGQPEARLERRRRNQGSGNGVEGSRPGNRKTKAIGNESNRQRTGSNRAGPSVRRREFRTGNSAERTASDGGAAGPETELRQRGHTVRQESRQRRSSSIRKSRSRSGAKGDVENEESRSSNRFRGNGIEAHGATGKPG
jgi:hypothetical protein